MGVWEWMGLGVWEWMGLGVWVCMSVGVDGVDGYMSVWVGELRD